MKLGNKVVNEFLEYAVEESGISKPTSETPFAGKDEFLRKKYFLRLLMKPYDGECNMVCIGLS
jgi:hypothetical protein